MAEKIYQEDEILALTLKSSPKIVKCIETKGNKFKKTVYWVSSMPSDIQRVIIGDTIFCKTPKGYLLCTIIDIHDGMYKVKKPWVYSGWVKEIIGVITFSIL